MKVTLTKDDVSGYYKLSGELCYADVVEVTQLGCRLISERLETIFDLHDITVDDDAVLVMLLNWVRCAKRAQRNIRFLNVSKKILDMAAVSGLVKLLPL